MGITQLKVGSFNTLSPKNYSLPLLASDRSFQSRMLLQRRGLEIKVFELGFNKAQALRFRVLATGSEDWVKGKGAFLNCFMIAKSEKTRSFRRLPMQSHESPTRRCAS
jgi:hypothetical protein